jgi:hypothetical protein
MNVEFRDHTGRGAAALGILHPQAAPAVGIRFCGCGLRR